MCTKKLTTQWNLGLEDGKFSSLYIFSETKENEGFRKLLSLPKTTRAWKEHFYKESIFCWYKYHIGFSRE